MASRLRFLGMAGTEIFGLLRWILTIAITTGVLTCTVLAFIDVLRRPDLVFVQEGKKTRKFWLLITGAGVLFGLLGFVGMVSIVLAIMAITPAAVYWYDVRPAIVAYRRKGRDARIRVGARNLGKFWSGNQGY